MLKTEQMTQVRPEPSQSYQRESQQEIKRDPSPALPREAPPIDEQKEPPFLERAEQDLLLLVDNLSSRVTSRGSAGAMVRAVRLHIAEAKREGYDDGLYVTYKNYRDVTRNWFWGEELYAIFNDTLDAIEDGHLLRQRQRSDPELRRENERLANALAAVRAAQQESAESKKDLRKAIRQKNLALAQLSGAAPLPKADEGDSPEPSPRAQVL